MRTEFAILIPNPGPASSLEGMYVQSRQLAATRDGAGCITVPSCWLYIDQRGKLHVRQYTDVHIHTGQEPLLIAALLS